MLRMRERNQRGGRIDERERGVDRHQVPLSGDRLRLDGFRWESGERNGDCQKAPAQIHLGD